MVLHVTLIHKRDVHALEFSNTAAVSDVLAKAKELCKKVEGPQLLFKGRELPSHAALSSLTSADTTKPIKLVVISKPAPAAVTPQHSFMRVPVLAKICGQLHEHEQSVGRLEGIPDWTLLEQDLAVATNEHLERTLLELDNVTGMQGDDRAAKKAAVTLVNSMCSRLDAVRMKRDPVAR